MLNRVGVLDKVLALGCPPLLREYLYVGGSEEPPVRPPQNPGELGYGLSVRREWLDQIVLERATSFPSVHLAQRSRIAGLVWDGDRVVGVRIGGKREEQEIRASLVVGADGRHSFVAQAVAAPVEEEEEGHRALYYCYVRDFSNPQAARPDGAEFSVRENEVAYVFPGDQGVTCVAISTGKAEFQRLKAGGLSYFRKCIAGHFLPSIARRRPPRRPARLQQALLLLARVLRPSADRQARRHQRCLRLLLRWPGRRTRPPR